MASNKPGARGKGGIGVPNDKNKRKASVPKQRMRFSRSNMNIKEVIVQKVDTSISAADVKAAALEAQREEKKMRSWLHQQAPLVHTYMRSIPEITRDILRENEREDAMSIACVRNSLAFMYPK
jgi:hypothetical protein